jgi:hypothetical protein
MKVDLVSPKDLGPRFNLVSFLPTAFLVLFILGILALGPPFRDPHPSNLATALSGLDGAQVAALVVAVIVVASIAHPLQLPLVRLLEGYWQDTAVGSAVASIGMEMHRRRQERLVAYFNEELPDPFAVRSSGGRIVRDVHRENRQAVQYERLGQLAARRLPTEYPRATENLLPTKLGNALRAAEDRAGQRYGLDTIAVWPRLHPHLPSPFAGAVNDLRDQFDAAARICVVLLLATLVSTLLLVTHGWWLLVPASTAFLSWVAYRAAVRAAVAYGAQLQVAFDLHRFDMLRGLHLPLPADPERERPYNEQLTAFFELSPEDFTLSIGPYQHAEEPPEATADRSRRRLLLRLLRRRGGKEAE